MCRIQPHLLDQHRQAARVLRKAEISGHVRRAARARLVPRNDGELVRQGGQLRLPHAAVHGSTVHEHQRPPFPHTLIGDLEPVRRRPPPPQRTPRETNAFKPLTGSREGGIAVVLPEPSSVLRTMPAQRKRFEEASGCTSASQGLTTHSTSRSSWATDRRRGDAAVAPPDEHGFEGLLMLSDAATGTTRGVVTFWGKRGGRAAARRGGHGRTTAGEHHVRGERQRRRHERLRAHVAHLGRWAAERADG